MDEKQVRREARLERMHERLDVDHPRCIECGLDDVRCLEAHHIAGRKFDAATVIFCRNHHRILSDDQRDHPPLVPVSAAARCVVWNDDTKERVKEIVKDAPFPLIDFEHPGRRHWYKDFPNGKLSSLVRGPGEISQSFANACEYVKENAGSRSKTARFPNPCLSG
jgi:hypothetical protein